MKARELAKILMTTPDLEVVCQEGIEDFTVSGIVDTVQLFHKGDFSWYYVENLIEQFTHEVKEDFLVIRSVKITEYE